MNQKDIKTIGEIAERAAKLLSCDRLTFVMDLSTCHKATPINLSKLSAFPDADFIHDISGINRHLDRETGKLKDSFWPRCGSPLA